MIKDKNGNRVNFIRKLNHTSGSTHYYDYTTQIKKQDGSTIWAAPACVCLPYSVSAASNYITCTRTKASEPKPQRSSNTTLYAGDYIYCGEEIAMDCNNSYYKTNYYSYPRIEYVISSSITMVSVLPKTFAFDPAYGYNNVAEAQGYNNNTNIVVGGDTQPRKMMLSANDFNGFMVFGNGTRPAFSSSGGKYVLTKSYSPTWDSTTQSTWQLVHDHYNGGTFETKGIISGHETTYSGSISVSISTTGVNQGKYQKTMTIKLTCNFAVPTRSGTEEQTRITLKPPSSASFLNQNTLACVASNGIYGIGNSIFGEDWYIERERMYTSDGRTQSLNIYLCGNNKRLYTYGMEFKKIEWLEKYGQEFDTISINANQHGGNTSPGQNYRILIHSLYGEGNSQGSPEESSPNYNPSQAQALWLVKGFTLTYNFIFDTSHKLITYPLELHATKDKIVDIESEA